jgi:hypothetical protein
VCGRGAAVSAAVNGTDPEPASGDVDNEEDWIPSLTVVPGGAGVGTCAALNGTCRARVAGQHPRALENRSVAICGHLRIASFGPSTAADISARSESKMRAQPDGDELQCVKRIGWQRVGHLKMNDSSSCGVDVNSPAQAR